MPLIKFDPRIHHSHHYLDRDSTCYFLRQYTARQGFSFSDTNDLIDNLKKCPAKSSQPELHYKSKAIDQCAAELLAACGTEWLGQFTLVPIPPSKSRDHPEYDDRMMRVLNKLGENQTLDIRELITQTQSIKPFHHGVRISIEQLQDLYQIEAQHLKSPPRAVLICDDVLTNGTHFQAAKNVITRTFGHIEVQGLFIARCTHIEPEEPDLLERF